MPCCWRAGAAGGQCRGRADSRFDTRGVKVLGDALKLMSAWRRRSAGSQGLPGSSLGTEPLPAQNVLVKPEFSPESGTHLSQHPGLLQPDSLGARARHSTAAASASPSSSSFSSSGLCWAMLGCTAASLTALRSTPASLHPLLRDWLSALQLLCLSHRPPGPGRMGHDSEKTGGVWVSPLC